MGSFWISCVQHKLLCTFCLFLRFYSCRRIAPLASWSGGLGSALHNFSIVHWHVKPVGKGGPSFLCSLRKYGHSPLVVIDPVDGVWFKIFYGAKLKGCFRVFKDSRILLILSDLRIKWINLSYIILHSWVILNKMWDSIFFYYLWL